MTGIKEVDDDTEMTAGLWGTIDQLTEKSKGMLAKAKKSKEGHVLFRSRPFERLSADDRNFVLQRVRAKPLEEARNPYRVFWLPDQQQFAVAINYPRSVVDYETDVDLETIPSLYAYVRGEITRKGGSFKDGGVLELRNVVDNGDIDRFRYVAAQVDGQTREVGDGSNATFTLKWHRTAQQIEIRISGRIASN